MLEQIMARQAKLIEERDKQNKKRKVRAAEDTTLPLTSVRPAHLTKEYLEMALRTAHEKAEAMTEDTKVIGVHTPESIHERIENFLQRHKGSQGMPQSKKSFALACMLKFLDQYEEATEETS